MQNYSIPSVDDNNPLYCPTVSATAYINSLRLHRRNGIPSRSHANTAQNDKALRSFTRLLNDALLYDDDDDDSPPEAPLPRSRGNPLRRQMASPGSSEEGPPGLRCLIPAWEREDTSHLPEDFWVGNDDRPLPLSRVGRSPRAAKRKRSSFSDIRGPPKHARSFQSIHDSSFDISVKREALEYSAARVQDTPIAVRHWPKPTNGLGISRTAVGRPMKDDPVLMLRIRALEDELYGPSIGTDSPRSIKPLIERLDFLLPGIRLKERLWDLPGLSHQRIVDFLAHNGHLNARVMAVLRTSEIQCISLTHSLVHEDGLNLSGNDVLPVFGKPNSFLSLQELSLSGTHIHDSDLMYIHHLPKLSTLLLNDTGISNEAIFLLVPLKRSLTQLSIATNAHITDDAVPALLLLSRLSFLSILATAIGMPGLRRLARTVVDEERIVDIEIPTACAQYVENMHMQYLLDPLPPLITNPDVNAQLSMGALRRNLAAHAAVNPAIVAEGGRAEMAERLGRLLEVRREDLLVRSMILGLGEG